MTVTYTTSDKFPGIRFPKLHRVDYSRLYDDVNVQYQKSYRDYIVNQWLEDNCKHGYYHSPGYLREKFIQFECDEEALMFALRWS
jgi:hypothetical protein